MIFVSETGLSTDPGGAGENEMPENNTRPVTELSSQQLGADSLTSGKPEVISRGTISANDGSTETAELSAQQIGGDALVTSAKPEVISSGALEMSANDASTETELYTEQIGTNALDTSTTPVFDSSGMLEESANNEALETVSNTTTATELLSQETGADADVTSSAKHKVVSSVESEMSVNDGALETVSDTRAVTKLSTQHLGAAARVSSSIPEVVSSEALETVSDTRTERKFSSRAEVDTYDEITKSEVASLDDWENVHKSCLSGIPPVDPEILKDLELRANDIAGNLDHMLGALANSLKAMSHVSTECLGAYSACVDHVSETVDVNIKSMYTLIARCEELNASVKPVQHLAEQVKEIKRTLDIFEAVCK